MMRGMVLVPLLVVLTTMESTAQPLSEAPRLVVNICIDQLRTDYLEHFSALYHSDGFRRLLTEGRVYEQARYPFSPVDRASAVTCIATGASPHYNKIISQQWLSRENKKMAYCVYDKQYGVSPANIAVSTISDELKVSTDGRAIVFSVASEQDAAILSAGHAADGAFWLNGGSTSWTTSTYYPSASQAWINAYNSQCAGVTKGDVNGAVTELALACVTDHAMGKDDVTDYLCVTLSATLPQGMGQRTEMESVYTSLDSTLATLLTGIEERVGIGKVLFIVTSTGYISEPDVDFARYRIPTGTFFINRTAQLLNMYLSAIYGSGTWVEGFYKNQIYLNHKLIESNRVSLSELLQRSKDLLGTMSGVANVDDSPYDTALTGDLWIEVCPGWKILNEETNEVYQSRTTFIPFPVIFFGTNVEAAHITEEMSTEYIAPTIAKAIRIRAPNACAAQPLF